MCQPLPTFFLVVSPGWVSEQSPLAPTIQATIETLMNVEEPDMRVLRIEGATVADVTKEAAQLVADKTFDARDEPRHWHREFLEAHDVEYYVEDRPTSRRYSTLNHIQQGF